MNKCTTTYNCLHCDIIIHFIPVKNKVFEMFAASFPQSAKLLSNLVSSLEILEPQNPELFYRMSLAFTRVVRPASPFTPSLSQLSVLSFSEIYIYIFPFFWDGG